MASRAHPSIASVKYTISDSILDWAADEGEFLKRALLQAYLVEALNACETLGDIQVFLPDGILSKLHILHSIEDLEPQIDPTVARRIRDSHEEAYGFIQQALLLSMIED